jgi:hypothetical protein
MFKRSILNPLLAVASFLVMSAPVHGHPVATEVTRMINFQAD